MADLDSPDNYHDRWMDDEFIEAFEDFQSLQTLTASLIFRILNTRYELEERFQAEEDLPTMDAFRLRHADEYAVSLSLSLLQTCIIYSQERCPQGPDRPPENKRRHRHAHHRLQPTHQNVL